MIRKIWNEKREYFNEDNALIKSQHGFKEFRIFGILISKQEIEYDADLVKKQASVGFNSK